MIQFTSPKGLVILIENNIKSKYVTMNIKTPRTNRPISYSYMFIYQVLISCWIKNVDTATIVEILKSVVEKHNVRMYKNAVITDHTIWLFAQRIRNYIPELRLVTGVYNKHEFRNQLNDMFKLILTIEREKGTSIIFRELYPTDSIVEYELQNRRGKTC